MFHGGGGTARAVMRETGWSAKADRENFIVVFPEGTRPNPSRRARFIGNPQTWNDGSKRPNLWAVRRKIDDVSFVNALIDDVIIRFNVDERRMYASGFSNGASMTFRVGRELSERFAAIAPVAGSDWLEEQSAMNRRISLIYITGTEDPLNPLDGGKIIVGSRSYGEKPPVREMIRKWATMLGCPLEARVIYDKNGVRGIAYGPGSDDSEVILYTIEEMGHTWPGGTSLLPESMVGKTSNRLNACDVIWEFFQKHPKK
jgi:polyhydroxybutyrate depolymerase